MAAAAVARSRSPPRGERAQHLRPAAQFVQGTPLMAASMAALPRPRRSAAPRSRRGPGAGLAGIVRMLSLPPARRGRTTDGVTAPSAPSSSSPSTASSCSTWPARSRCSTPPTASPGGGRYEVLVATPGGAASAPPAASRSAADIASSTDAPAGRSTRCWSSAAAGPGRRSTTSRSSTASARLAGRAERITSVCTGALAARRRRPARRLPGHHPLGVVRPARRAAPRRRGPPRPDLRPRPRPLDLGRRHRRHRPGPRPGRGRPRRRAGPRGRGWLVVFARRPGGQAQFSAQLQAQAARTPAVAEVQRWLPDHLDRRPHRRPRSPTAPA